MAFRVIALAVVAAAALSACDRGAGTGPSGSEGVSGATGRGTGEAGSRSQSTAPGTGLHGGLGASQGQTAMGAGPAASAATQGSRNTTSDSSVGRR